MLICFRLLQSKEGSQTEKESYHPLIKTFFINRCFDGHHVPAIPPHTAILAMYRLSYTVERQLETIRDNGMLKVQICT